MSSNRFDYVKYDTRAQLDQETIKQWFVSLEEIIEKLKPGRAKSLALTSLEESYMWVGKAIRDEQIARNGPATLQEERKDG